MRRLLLTAALLAIAAGLVIWNQSRPGRLRAASPAAAESSPGETTVLSSVGRVAATSASQLDHQAGTASGAIGLDQAAASLELPEGYRLLLEKAYLPSDFDQETFDEVWRVWPEPLRSQAAAATPDERRQMAYRRYGLDPRPGDEAGRPLQYVVDEQGRWTMNCLSCHGGSVAGQVWPGLPNTHFALQTLTEEIRAVKLGEGKPLARMDFASLLVPLGGSRGTTNAVMFGVVLMSYRDSQLNVYPNRLPPQLVNHDMDPPPWWHFRKKQRLYIDGFASKGHRALMPFLLVRENGPEKFAQWEDDFRQIYQWLETLEPPPYPYPIDPALAAAGEVVFNETCARCHGTYGRQETYPEQIVPLAEIGTNPVRLRALSVEHRRNYAASWFAHFGQEETIAEPQGYVAPPLDGIWASTPYLHNGSVPTLWHLLHSVDRPVVWRRVGDPRDEYDQQRLGLSVETFVELPDDVSGAERREYFDTRLFGKSAAGHTFPDVLTEAEKAALLEYLKTL